MEDNKKKEKESVKVFDKNTIKMISNTENFEENTSDIREPKSKESNKFTEKEAKPTNYEDEGEKRGSLVSLSVPSNSKQQDSRKHKNSPSDSSVSFKKYEQNHDSSNSKNSKAKSFNSGISMMDVDRGENYSESLDTGDPHFKTKFSGVKVSLSLFK